MTPEAKLLRAALNKAIESYELAWGGPPGSITVNPVVHGELSRMKETRIYYGNIPVRLDQESKAPFRLEAGKGRR